jgi:cell division protein DivIC
MSAVREKNVAKIQTTYLEQQEMAEISTARKRKLLMRRLSLFMTFAIFVSYFMISSFLSQNAVIEAKAAQKKKLEHQLTELKNQQDILKEDIVKLNDDDYIAKLARKEYFFSAKDGSEKIFNLPDDKEGKSTNE